MPTNFEIWKAKLPSLTERQLESAREAHKVSVGGGMKGPIEAEIGIKFMVEIERELQRRAHAERDVQPSR